MTTHLGYGEVVMKLFASDFPGSNRKKPSVTVWAAHGRNSAARSKVAVLNELNRIAADREGIDIFLLGHHHQIASQKVQKLRWTGGENGGEPQLNHRDVVLAATGSYMLGIRAG